MQLITYIIFNFIIYSFIGWIIELLYNYAIRKDFKKAGFLKGPYKPMYGIAVTILILCKEIFHFNSIIMLILCFIVPSTIEYISGYLLKRFFNEVYWAYSDLKYNINGFVTLRFSIYWTVLSLIGIYIFQPYIYNNIFIKFYGTIHILTYVLISMFFVDLFAKISSKDIKKKQIVN